MEVETIVRRDDGSEVARFIGILRPEIGRIRFRFPDMDRPREDYAFLREIHVDQSWENEAGFSLVGSVDRGDFTARAIGRVYEQMVRVAVGEFAVRGWLRLDRESASASNDKQRAKFIGTARGALARQGRPSADSAMAILDALWFVNAVEVLDPSGQGVVAYQEWP